MRDQNRGCRHIVKAKGKYWMLWKVQLVGLEVELRVAYPYNVCFFLRRHKINELCTLSAYRSMVLGDDDGSKVYLFDMLSGLFCIELLVFSITAPIYIGNIETIIKQCPRMDAKQKQHIRIGAKQKESNRHIEKVRVLFWIIVVIETERTWIQRKPVRGT